MPVCLRPIATLLLVLFATSMVTAHCEVPCGIYGDKRRFEHMMEDQETIAKAIAQINELAGTHNADRANQLIRWVTTKEAHCTNVQHTMAQYFLTQRIKSDQANYTERLTTAHAVMVAAMKCKQAADPETALALEKAIKAFEAAYNKS
ncbi:MAG: superoxide dismutase [Ni] [Planctomycetota bacterium]